MRSSTIRSGSAAILAAAMLTACGGHGVVPSQSFAPAVSNGIMPNAVPDKTSPCDVSGMYYFHGNCVPFNMNMSSVTTVTLGKFSPYHGIKIVTTLSKFDKPPQGVKTTPAVMGDAIGTNGDITGKVNNKTFPLYVAGQDICINNQNKLEKCFGKTFVYAELINKSKYTLKPDETPAFYITDTNGFPGKNLCFPAILTTLNGKLVWAPNTALGGKPSQDTLRIASAKNPGQLIFKANGQFIVAGVCE